MGKIPEAIHSKMPAILRDTQSNQLSSNFYWCSGTSSVVSTDRSLLVNTIFEILTLIYYRRVRFNNLWNCIDGAPICVFKYVFVCKNNIFLGLNVFLNTRTLSELKFALIFQTFYMGRLIPGLLQTAAWLEWNCKWHPFSSFWFISHL